MVQFQIAALICIAGVFGMDLFYDDRVEIEKAFVGRKVGDLLDFFESEPPGKLQAISFVLDKRLRVFVRLEYSPAVFSETGKWDFSKVRERPIRAVKVLIEKKSP